MVSQSLRTNLGTPTWDEQTNELTKEWSEKSCYQREVPPLQMISLAQKQENMGISMSMKRKQAREAIVSEYI